MTPPPPGARPHVLFSITTGWGIRNFVQSEIFAELGRTVDLSVATVPAFRAYFDDARARGVIHEVVDLPDREPLFWRLVRQSRKAIFQALHDISTARIKRESAPAGPKRWLQTASWRAQRLIAGQWQLDLLDSIERRFARYGPRALPVGVCLVVNASPFDHRDNSLQRLAARLGVPTVAIVPSWDNPTSKGCIRTDADEVWVWSSNQAREIAAYYPTYRPDQVVVTGIPQFDIYRRPLSGALQRQPFLGSLGIDPSRRVILYATCSEKLFPSEPTVVEELVQALDRGDFGDAHLLVRCHPADRAKRYAFSGNDRVTVWESTAGGSLATWKPPSEELDVLAGMLLHSAVCINTASTMTLDALACGKPVVNVAYDGVEQPPYEASTRRYYDYEHYRPIAASGAVDIARSADDLLRMISQALSDPARNSEARAAVVSMFCDNPAGGSGKFMVDRIAALAHGRPG